MGFPLPFILSIPHGGLGMPPEAADRCALSEEALFYESDVFSRELYGMADAVLGEVTQGVSRAIVDVNRPPDYLPPKTDDGAIKTTTSLGEPVWRPGEAPDHDLQTTLLERYYHPYHQRLEALIEAHRAEARLLIDCHTMSPLGPPAARDAGKPRPLICLGNLGTERGAPSRDGRTSLPRPVTARLRRIMAEVFAPELTTSRHPNPIALNRPFLGGYITHRYSSTGFWVVQIELSQALYLQPPWFDPLRRTVDEGRLRELNAKLRTTLVELAASIDAP